MIERVKIKNYKCIDNADIELKPLTIVTGLNSTGKSSLLHALLLPESFHLKQVIGSISKKYEIIKCRYITDDNISIIVDYGSAGIEEMIMQPTKSDVKKDLTIPIGYGNGLYYLSANRYIRDITATKSEGDLSISPDGMDSFGTYQWEKSNPVIEGLYRYEESKTLGYQIDRWMSYILEQSIRIRTEVLSGQEIISVTYESDGIPNITPSNLGTGVTFIAEILITCLRAKKGDVVVIENPEIHLHPSAQAKLGEFFAFIAHAGVQVIIETHCEHLINRVQYAVYANELRHDEVTILYKRDIISPFDVIPLKRGGKYAVPFPDGFFDATLNELMEVDA